jgi:hypothetical protein
MKKVLTLWIAFIVWLPILHHKDLMGLGSELKAAEEVGVAKTKTTRKDAKKLEAEKSKKKVKKGSKGAGGHGAWGGAAGGGLRGSPSQHPSEDYVPKK